MTFTSFCSPWFWPFFDLVGDLHPRLSSIRPLLTSDLRRDLDFPLTYVWPDLSPLTSIIVVSLTSVWPYLCDLDPTRRWPSRSSETTVNPTSTLSCLWFGISAPARRFSPIFLKNWKNMVNFFEHYLFGISVWHFHRYSFDWLHYIFLAFYKIQG